MNKIAMLGVLAATLAAAGTAAAQERIRANERYCLESSSGGRGGGSSPLLCRFETFGQCMQSRTGPGDRCMLNPRLAR
jgi:hypothetical protein